MKNYQQNQLDERQINLRNKFGYQSFGVLIGLSFVSSIIYDQFSFPIDASDMFIINIFISALYHNIRCLIANYFEKSDFKKTIFFLTFLLIAESNDTDFTVYNICFFVFVLLGIALSIIGLIKCKKQEKQLDEIFGEE